MNSHNASDEGKESQLMEQHYNVVVGIANPRAKLRVSVLLNTMPDYYVKYVTTDREIVDAIMESDIVIGSGITAREGILHRKPVIVVGEYGLGGLITPTTLREQFDTGFRGRIYGMKEEYFSLEKVENEILRSSSLTFQELQMMSNQMVTFLHNIDF